MPKILIQFLLHAARTTEEGRRRVVFAFYTSMREANARPIADYLTGGRRVDIYARENSTKRTRLVNTIMIPCAIYHQFGPQ